MPATRPFPRLAATPLLVAAALWLAGCIGIRTQGPTITPPPKAGATHAVAVITPTAGNAAHGTVSFTQDAKGVRVVAVIEGLAPGGTHGFHIHQYGDCSAADGTSTGGHYNPEGYLHAGTDTPQRHAGDMGNLQAGDNGVARYEAVLDNISIDGPHNPILGRGIIIHAGADDLQTQPTGNAGARIGCGVIGLAKTTVE